MSESPRRPGTQAWLIVALVAFGAGCWDLGVSAQAGPPASGVLDTIQIRPNVYVIFGAGSNVTVHIGSEGAILVDSAPQRPARTYRASEAANPTAGFRRRYGSDSGPWTTDMFVEAVYRGLADQKDKS
jgi:hypothetical protein